MHLITFDDSPTRLDSRYYGIDPDVDVVVDGNQYYWVRIGSVKAGQLSTHELARFVCHGVFLGIAGAVDGVVAFVAFAPAAAAAIPTLGGSVALYYVGVGVAAAVIDGTIIDWIATTVCPIVEKEFVDKKYHYVAEDGTILLVVKKDNTNGIQELKNNGIDLTKLMHFTPDNSL